MKMMRVIIIDISITLNEVIWLLIEQIWIKMIRLKFIIVVIELVNTSKIQHFTFENGNSCFLWSCLLWILSSAVMWFQRFRNHVMTISCRVSVNDANLLLSLLTILFSESPLDSLWVGWLSINGTVIVSIICESTDYGVLLDLLIHESLIRVNLFSSQVKVSASGLLQITNLLLIVPLFVASSRLRICIQAAWCPIQANNWLLAIDEIIFMETSVALIGVDFILTIDCIVFWLEILVWIIIIIIQLMVVRWLSIEFLR